MVAEKPEPWLRALITNNNPTVWQHENFILKNYVCYDKLPFRERGFSLQGVLLYCYVLLIVLRLGIILTASCTFILLCSVDHASRYNSCK
jgi:hypothetical protein